MSDKIRKINGREYYGRYDITPEDENEDFDFSEYIPSGENSTDIEDIYFYIKNNKNPSNKKYNDTPSYNEMKKALSIFLNNRIDKEIEKYGTYSNSYKNKNYDKYDKYLSASTEINRIKDLHSKTAKKYSKQIRKLAKIYKDMKEGLGSADGSVIAALYEKYIDPNFDNYRKSKISEIHKQRSADQQEAYDQYKKGARAYLEDPEDRYKPIGMGSTHHDFKIEEERSEVIDASKKPKKEEPIKKAQEKDDDEGYRYFDWKRGSINGAPRPDDLPDPEERFKLMR